MLKTLEGKELAELLLTTRKFPPVFSDEFGNLKVKWLKGFHDGGRYHIEFAPQINGLVSTW